MEASAFQGRRLGEAFAAWKRMIDGDGLIALGLAGSMASAGLSPLVVWLVERGYVNVVVSTSANATEDLLEHRGVPLHRVDADHADDEARHHSYFSNVLDVIWPQITKEQQSIIGPLLPHFIIKSLEPHYETIRQRLAKFDLTRDEIEQIVEESYPRSEVIAGLRKTARVTLSILERNRIYEDPGTLEAFHTSGLL